MTSKKDLSERDICTKYIQPALEKAGWNPLTQNLTGDDLLEQLRKELV
jgi:type I restriction enzyme, R subunit